MSATITLRNLAEVTPLDGFGAWAADAEVPVIAGLPQAQGDVYIIPTDGLVPPAVAPLPFRGEVLVAGRGGNAHVLAGGGYYETTSGRQTLGTLTVPPGEVAWLFHAPENGPRQLAQHAALAIGEGTYVIRRQREQADEIRIVQD